MKYLRWDNPGPFTVSGGLVFFSDASCIQLDTVQELYSPAFRGSSGGRVWVRAVIGINYGESFDPLFGHLPPNHSST